MESVASACALSASGEKDATLTFVLYIKPPALWLRRATRCTPPQPRATRPTAHPRPQPGQVWPRSPCNQQSACRSATLAMPVCPTARTETRLGGGGTARSHTDRFTLHQKTCTQQDIGQTDGWQLMFASLYANSRCGCRRDAVGSGAAEREGGLRSARQGEDGEEACGQAARGGTDMVRRHARLRVHGDLAGLERHMGFVMSSVA